MQLPFDRPPPGLLAIPAPTGPFRPHRPLQVPPVLRINSESCRIHHVFRLHVRRAKSDELLLKKRKKRKLHFMQFWAGSFQEDYRIEVVVLTVTGTYPQVGTQVKKKYYHKSLQVGLYHDKKSWFRPKIKKLILARSQNHAFSNHAFSTLLRFQNNMLVRNLAITMQFLSVNGLLWMKSTS